MESFLCARKWKDENLTFLIRMPSTNNAQSSCVLQHTSTYVGVLKRLNNSSSSRKDMGFPGSSAGKESACNVGDPSWIPGLGRSPGEGIDYPLQYSWVPLVAQMVKNPPTM